VIAVFTLLEHAPFWALGINRHLHYKVESEDQWHRLGRFLAPKAAWSRWLTDPGMRSLTIEGFRAEAPDARIQFRVEPSLRVHPGIYFSLNEHREVKEAVA
jgi:hypothetical protein